MGSLSPILLLSILTILAILLAVYTRLDHITPTIRRWAHRFLFDEVPQQAEVNKQLRARIKQLEKRAAELEHQVSTLQIDLVVHRDAVIERFRFTSGVIKTLSEKNLR